MEHLITKLLKSFFVIGIVIFMQSCYYDNVEDLYPQLLVCDTTNVTYSNSVWPVINANCTSCHGGGAPAGNIRLENYNDISSVANNGSLLGTIRHENGWLPMPKGGGKLNNCDIAKIETWVNQGIPDN